MATVRDVFDGTAATTAYEYGTGDQISKVTYDSGYESYSYDLFNRLDQWYTYHGSTPLIHKNISYEVIDDQSGSSRPVAWSYVSTGGYSALYNYTYDGNGNILSETLDGYRTTYVYDSANQLIRENNQRANRTWTWTYDAAGNILTKKEYAYTTGTLGNPLDVVTYTYENSTWGDLLTVYGGVALSYDNIGNLISYGPRSYTWTQGRQLASMSNGSTTWTYAYDADGMRTSRTDGTITYTYVYSGSQLSWMTVGDTELQFTYDATGRPLAVTYNGTTYYYALNLQGDVVAILDSTGAPVVYYTYDAWGKPLTTTGSKASTLGQDNPLRYRGYVYDQDTGLYYLQSRYYNPEWGRFINADVYVSTGQGILGNNMFAYCLNNPCNGADATGRWTVSIGIGVGATFFIGASEFHAITFDRNGVSHQRSISSPEKRETTTVGLFSSGFSGFLQWTAMDSAYDLDGVSTSLGGEVNDYGFDLIIDKPAADMTGEFIGVQLSYGFVSSGIDLHVSQSYTETVAYYSWREIWNLIVGWLDF